MAALLVLGLILAMVGHSYAAAAAGAAWCACKGGGSDDAYQKTIDYACGAGADCNPIHQNGPCFQPNTVKAHCDYAVNSFFQRKGQGQGTCEFAGVAAVVTTDPSTPGCTYPSSASGGGGGTTTSPGTTNSPGGTTMPNSPTTSSTTTGPYSNTPSSGVFGTGMGPTGVGINNDMSDGGFRLLQRSVISSSSSSTLLLSGLMMLLWG